MSSHLFDKLTGLPSSGLFLHSLATALELHKRASEKAVVLLIEHDLETVGSVMPEISERLRTTVRATDLVAVLGDNTFAILLTQLKDSDNAARIADNLIQKMKEPYQIDGLSKKFHPVIGIAVYPDDGKTAAEILENAKQAKEGATSNALSRYAFYTEDMNARIHKHRTLVGSLLKSWQINDFLVAAQAVYAFSGQWTQTELTFLWQHPTEGLLEQKDFMPLLVEVGLYQEALSVLAEKALFGAKHFPHIKWFFNIGSALDIKNNYLYVPTTAIKGEPLGKQVGIVWEASLLESNEKVRTNIKAAMEDWHSAGGFIQIDNIGEAYLPANKWEELPFSQLRVTSDVPTQFEIDSASYKNAELVALSNDIYSTRQEKRCNLTIQPINNNWTEFSSFLKKPPPNLF